MVIKYGIAICSLLLVCMIFSLCATEECWIDVQTKCNEKPIYSFKVSQQVICKHFPTFHAMMEASDVETSNRLPVIVEYETALPIISALRIQRLFNIASNIEFPKDQEDALFGDLGEYKVYKLMQFADKYTVSTQVKNYIAQHTAEKIYNILNPHFEKNEKLPENIMYAAAESFFLEATKHLPQEVKIEKAKNWYPKQYMTRESDNLKEVINSWCMSDAFRVEYDILGEKLDIHGIIDAAFKKFSETVEYRICYALGCSIWHCHTEDKKISRLLYQALYQKERSNVASPTTIMPIFNLLSCMWWDRYLHLPILSKFYMHPLMDHSREKISHEKVRLYDVDAQYINNLYDVDAQYINNLYDVDAQYINNLSNIKIQLVDDMSVPFDGLRKTECHGSVTIVHVTEPLYCGLVHKKNFPFHACKNVLKNYVTPFAAFIVGSYLFWGGLCLLDNCIDNFIKNMISKEPQAIQHTLGLIWPNWVTAPQDLLYTVSNYRIAKTIASKAMSIMKCNA